MAKKTQEKVIEKVEVTAESLQTNLQTKRNDLFEAIRSHRSGELVNPKVINKYRKEIARTLTKMREIELAVRKESK